MRATGLRTKREAVELGLRVVDFCGWWIEDRLMPQTKGWIGEE